LNEQLFSSLTPINIEIDKIYLDPNNPRFTNEIWISDEGIDDPAKQQELVNRIQSESPVISLMDSIETNGYLPIDRIVARQFKDGSFVVLEGNRRVTAAKILLERHANHTLVLKDYVLETLKSIPVLLYTGTDQDAAWIFQGLRHISGIMDWSAYNKAHLLVKQMEEHTLSLTDIGKIFGLSSIAAGQYVRSYQAYRQLAEHRDYQNVVDQKVFPYLQEVFGRGAKPLRDWLQWNDEEESFTNIEHFEIFLSWLYPKLNEEDEEDPNRNGNWEKRLIPRAIDIRDVSSLVGTEYFRDFLEGSELSEVQAKKKVKEISKQETPAYYLKAISDFNAQMLKLPILEILQSEQRQPIIQQIENLGNTVERVLPILRND
jgi:hypothetical protein